jgi:hypothetical protein
LSRRIPEFVDFERRITLSSPARTVRAGPGRVSPTATSVEDAEVAHEMNAKKFANFVVDGEALAPL